MAEALHRECVYILYYFSVQFGQIVRYWVWGMLIGSAISVFVKSRIHALMLRLKGRRSGIIGIAAASALGIASPLCMYGTIPIAASFSSAGTDDGVLAAFMMSSILLNPQLIFYSMALERAVVLIRVFGSFICGIAAGLIVRAFYGGAGFFSFGGFAAPASRDIDPNIFLRFIKNLGRNFRATGGYFLLGVLLSALFQRYVPAEAVSALFGKENARMGVLLAATVGVPLYACGGGTIPLLLAWLEDGMSIGSAAAFMITGPATKLTNLGALKIVLGAKHFALYIAFVLTFAFVTGRLADMFL